MKLRRKAWRFWGLAAAAIATVFLLAFRTDRGLAKRPAPPLNDNTATYRREAPAALSTASTTRSDRSDHEARVPPRRPPTWVFVEDFPRPLARFETVFWEPRDSESLRRLLRDEPVVLGKTVLEIGTGSGLLALCCLAAGAESVVATDVNWNAIANANHNARLLGMAERFEARLVPKTDPGAYSVVGASETFDVILSNPPWEDADPITIADHALYDPDFGLLESILAGLDRRLNPGGALYLAYGCVDAVARLRELAERYQLDLRTLDDRDVDTLSHVFLPGMLFEIRVDR